MIPETIDGKHWLAHLTVDGKNIAFLRLTVNVLVISRLTDNPKERPSIDKHMNMQ